MTGSCRLVALSPDDAAPTKLTSYNRLDAVARLADGHSIGKTEPFAPVRSMTTIASMAREQRQGGVNQEMLRDATQERFAHAAMRMRPHGVCGDRDQATFDGVARVNEVKEIKGWLLRAAGHCCMASEAVRLFWRRSDRRACRFGIGKGR